MTVAIRGATTVVENDIELIYEASEEMIRKIIEENQINIDDIVSIIFTATKDIDMAYPAKAIRGMGITKPAFMCFQEMYVVGSLQKCIRVMITVEGDYNRDNIKNIYLRGAVGLRPDLVKES